MASNIQGNVNAIFGQVAQGLTLFSLTPQGQQIQQRQEGKQMVAEAQKARQAYSDQSKLEFEANTEGLKSNRAINNRKQAAKAAGLDIINSTYQQEAQGYQMMGNYSQAYSSLFQAAMADRMSQDSQMKAQNRRRRTLEKIKEDEEARKNNGR